MATTSSSTNPPSLTGDARTETIKHRLIQRGVYPTPKILHALRKKDAQKKARRDKKQSSSQNSSLISKSLPEDEEESRFKAISREYRAVMKAVEVGKGRPWERSDALDLNVGKEELDGGKLKGEHLEDLRLMFEERNGNRFDWLLDDDVEGGGIGESGLDGGRKKGVGWRQKDGSDKEKIRWLVHRLNSTNLHIRDWKFPKLMKQSGLLFAENCLLEILKQLENLGNWQQALFVVEWVYNEREYRHSKSRFVYTKLLSVLGKSRRHIEALRIYNMMRDDCQIYPDMAAYHSIAVTLGQAGLVKELINLIECMKQKPKKKLKNMRHGNWDPCLEADVVIYNAILNACVPTHQWKGVSWVLQQMRFSGLKPNGATYGLAMEVMLEAGKYDIVHKLFGSMQRNGLALKGLTYKVLVRAYWKEGRISDAIMAVRDMEQKGIVGVASVYYELACCLCNSGLWKDAMLEVEKMKRLPLTKPLEVAFTGMILSSMDGGHLDDCISIFKHMKGYCDPNIGTVNVMLKVYSRRDMFTKAKQLFEAVKIIGSDVKSYRGGAKDLSPDASTYTLMLEASATSHQWEYFEHLYKEMTVFGYQLDQNRHARLLVEASKAGKCHLLEHAFETILEVGEVPCISMFTELLCQTVSCRNYERTIPLINSMAHASLQVNEKQWIDLFERNRNRIDGENLHVLFNLLSNDSEVVREDPVSSLVRSLQYLCCGEIKSIDMSASPSHQLENQSKPDSLGVIKRLNGRTQDRMLASCDNFVPGENYRSSLSERTQFHVPVKINVEENVHEEPNHCEFFPLGSSGDANTSNFTADHDFDGYFNSTPSDSILSSATEKIIDSTEQVGLSCGSDKLPSASEILESWKENRIKDVPVDHYIIGHWECSEQNRCLIFEILQVTGVDH